MSNQTNEQKPGLSNEQKAKMKKYAVFGAMGVICAAIIFLIFSPSADDKAKREAQSGFNTEIPMPKEEGLIDDKRNAYEQEQLKQRQSERMRSLQDFSAMVGDHTTETDELALITDEQPVITLQRTSTGAGSQRQSPIQNSAVAYQDINRSLGSFYERQRDDPEKERLKQELEELKMRMEETENRNNPVDDHLEMMEKSFQIASKYMPGFTGTPPTVSPFTNPDGLSDEFVTEESSETAGAEGLQVSTVRDRTVSMLQSETGDAELLEMFSQPRNMMFYTAVGDESKAGTKNTVSACIHTDQTVMNGQVVRLRLLEILRVGNLHIPRNSLISGTARIQGERLGITVTSLETEGTVLPVAITVYDLDGQSGIFIPNMQELSAGKEIVANMGTNAGTSFNLSNDAEKQFIADMGRNVIQGVSQFTAKKLREVKVHLKAGYRVFLIPDGNLKTNSQQQMANR
jgi:conjugative transposon TraM protein